MLQDGRDGGVAPPEARWLEGLEGGVGDRGEAQRGARHPRDVIETARLLITCGYIQISHTGQTLQQGYEGSFKAVMNKGFHGMVKSCNGMEMKNVHDRK